MDVLRTLVASNKYEIRRNILKNFLDNLCENKYLTLTNQDKAQFLESFPSSYGYKDMKEDATRQKDADLVLKMVMHLLKEKEYSSAIHWLSIAKVYNPEHDFFKNPANIQALLSQVTGNLTINSLFRENKHAWLLDQIAICPAIEDLYFGTFFNPDCVNENFANFLAKTSFVKTLQLGATWSADMRMRLDHVQYLAKGLTSNISVQNIELSSQLIGDEGLILIIEALKANLGNKVTSLNVASCSITAVGAEALLNYMRMNNPLIHVNLYGNRNIPPELVKTVHAMANKISPLQHSLASGSIGFGKKERGLSLFFSSPDHCKLEKLKVDNYDQFSTIKKRLAERTGNCFFSLEYKETPLEPMSRPKDHDMNTGDIIVMRNVQ